MKAVHASFLALLSSAKRWLVAGTAGMLLAACNRSEPTPDPPVMPPNPQTLTEGVDGMEWGIHRTIFVYPESAFPLPPVRVGIRIAT